MKTCIKNPAERQNAISKLPVNRQNKKSLDQLKSSKCRLCSGYYMYPKRHFRKHHSDQKGEWKVYFCKSDDFNQNETELDRKLNSFTKDYLLNPRASALDIESNSNSKRNIQGYKNRLKETIIFCTKKNNPTDDEIINGTKFLCDNFLNDQNQKGFKVGTTKNKLTAHKHYLTYLDFQVKRNIIGINTKDLSNSIQEVENTLRSLKGRINMNDSQTAVKRSKFFWSSKHEQSWRDDPKSIEAEKLLNNPELVENNKNKFVQARNHLLLKIARKNGKRNLEVSTLKIEHSVEPNAMSGLNENGELEWVLYNENVKTKKKGGISKITLDQVLMTQLLSFISTIRPKFSTSESGDNIFITFTGKKFLADSMSKIYNTFNIHYDGIGKPTNQNFRHHFGKIANQFGTTKQRRICSDQQDHSENTASKYYEQCAELSINAVNQNTEFEKAANTSENLKRSREETESATNIRKKMKAIKQTK